MTSTMHSPALHAQAVRLLEQLGIAQLFVDVGTVVPTGAFELGWLSSRYIPVDLRLGVPLADEELLRVAGRLLGSPLVTSLSYARSPRSHDWPTDDPRASACARILSGDDVWTLELTIWP